MFEEADEDLLDTIELAEAGDVGGSQVPFFAPHKLTHNVDGPLRQVDEALAIRLCNEVLIIEKELVGSRDPPITGEQAREIRELLTTIATALDMEQQYAVTVSPFGHTRPPRTPVCRSTCRATESPSA